MESESDQKKIITFPKVFNGYKVIKSIGHGATSSVILVENIKTKEKYSAKIVSKERTQNFDAEIDILKTLNHPNIIKFIESFEIQNYEDEKLVVIITEYCENGDLLYYLSNHDFENEQEKKRIIYQFLSAIIYLHSKGIAHGDIKPQNILLDSNLNAKLCDFGFCHTKIIEGNDAKRGTLLYAAPELLAKGEFNTLKTDIYSIGITIYAINELKLPYIRGDADSIKKQIKKGELYIPKSIERRLYELVVNCTKMDPLQRPNIEDVIESEYLIEITLNKLIKEKRYSEFEKMFISYTKLLLENSNKKVNENIFKIYENLIILNKLREKIEAGQNDELQSLEKKLFLYIKEHVNDKSIFKANKNCYITDFLKGFNAKNQRKKKDCLKTKEMFYYLGKN